jgi:hypothetical protein
MRKTGVVASTCTVGPVSGTGTHARADLKNFWVAGLAEWPACFFGGFYFAFSLFHICFVVVLKKVRVGVFGRGAGPGMSQYVAY